MTRAALSAVPGLGHFLHGRPLRGTALGLTWAAFLALAVRTGADAAAALPGRVVDVGIALAFLGLVLGGLPVVSALDCRRLRRAAAAGRRAGESQWRMFYRRFLRNRVATTGVVLVAVLYAVAILAPLLATHDPDAQEDIVRTRYQAPGSEFLLGTDKFGRDVYSRILYGARISLSIGFVAVGIAVTLGTMAGAVSGYFGGRTDWLVMRLVDVLIAFPRLFIVLTLIAIFSPRIWLIIAVLGATSWMGVARLVRGEILSLREREFMQAARALGLPHRRVLFRHVLPNTLSPVIVSATLMIGDVILTEAVLSFLGLGVQPPTASWGNIINQGRDNLLGAWWIATFPGMAIVITVVAYNLLGDGLRDALDPRLRD